MQRSLPSENSEPSQTSFFGVPHAVTRRRSPPAQTRYAKPDSNNLWATRPSPTIGMTEQIESPEESSLETQVLRRVLWPLYPPVDIVVGQDDHHTMITGHATFHPQPEHVGAPGWVQGGLSATVLDFVAARIAKAALESRVATGTLDLRYRQPVLLDGGPYRVEGTAPVPRGRTVRVDAAILDAADRPLVEASGLFVAVER